MIEILLWSVVPVAYLIISGFVHKKVYTYLRGSETFRHTSDDKAAAFFAAALWPATGPVVLGRMLAGYQGTNLAERKQRKALDKADFMIEIAKRAEIEAKHLAAAEAANPLSMPHGYIKTS